MEKNACELTGRVEFSKEEIPAVNMHAWQCTDRLQALKGKPLSSMFSTDGTLISAYAAPYCGRVTAAAAVVVVAVVKMVVVVELVVVRGNSNTNC